MLKKNNYSVLTAVLCLSILVIDFQTALSGAQAGITLCLKSIIPTLLPFSILSKYLCASLLGSNIRALTPIGRITGMPKGSESILLLSFVGGYPLGAQCINDAYERGCLTRVEAERLLGFCNNAGPAFLFGILSCLFPSAIALWSLYVIHILSAILTGALLPGKSINSCRINQALTHSFSQTVEKSAKTVALVSCWIILFKIVLEFIKKWLSNLLDPVNFSLLAGILELSNGCLSLIEVDSIGLRYILCAFFLNWGGICIYMQTLAVTNHRIMKSYIPVKLLQTGISVFLASVTQHLIFSAKNIFTAGKLTLLSLISVFICIILTRKGKIMVAFAE